MWLDDFQKAMRKYDAAREESRQAQHTVGLPPEVKDAAAQAEHDASVVVATLYQRAANEMLFMMRMAVETFPDDFRDLLRRALTKRPVPASPEDERRELAMALYLRILDAGATITKEGVKNTDRLSNLDKKLIPKLKDELMLLMKPE